MIIGMEESYNSIEGPPYQRSMVSVLDGAYITSFSTEESTGTDRKECEEDSDSGRSCSLSGQSYQELVSFKSLTSSFTKRYNYGLTHKHQYYLANSRTNREGETINPQAHVRHW